MTQAYQGGAGSTIPTGPAGLVGLVGECLALPPEAERPVIVLLGPRGSGASEAHGALMARFGTDQAPFAYLNFGSEQPLRPRYALGLIARQLERKLARYRVSRFPRLTLGLLVSDSDIGDLGTVPLRDQRRQLHRRVGRFEDRTFDNYGDYLSGFLQVGGSALGLPAGIPAVFEDMVMGAARDGARMVSGLLSRHRFAESARWYAGHRLTGGSNPWDAVVELNHWRRGSAEDTEKLDLILFAAFLEDLRRNAELSFAPCSYLLLLDGCHTEHGRRFLQLLLATREDTWAAARGAGLPESAAGDPLTVVASTNKWLPGWGPPSGEPWGWTVQPPDHAGLSDWRERRPPGSGAHWYPLRLRDLTLDEVRTRLSDRPQRDPALAPFVHRLTCGLPRAVQQVLTLLDQADLPASGGHERAAWLRRLPERTVPVRTLPARTPPQRTVPGPPRPGGPGRYGAGPGGPRPTPAPPPAPGEVGVPLVDAALGPLLDGFDETERATLERCAATPDLSVGCQVFGEGSGPARGAEASGSLFTKAHTGFLLAHGRPGDRPVLHPWPRRLLLWRLAERPADWAAAHQRLSDHYTAEGQPVRAMYHRLALHEIDEVTDFLARRLEAVDTSRWVAELNTVSSAPNRVPKDKVYRDLLGPLTHSSSATGAPLEAAVRGLLVARWLWKDPLVDPEMRLGPALAARFERLSQEHPRGESLHLLNEAERYRSWIHPQTWAEEG
ncbi:hypothetical protein ACQEU8_08510 [Streptomyces sp. CA-250714]|uniref:hypothetical protein n=1 Tax=Streptomyces sp. CA-250714 TaxID=3240060 RepID=UPI003D92B519